MFATVQLLNGFEKELTYVVPKHLQHLSLEGTIVQVPLKKKQLRALVINQMTTFKEVSFKLKEIIALDPFPSDKNYKQFIEKIAFWHFTKPISLYQRLQGMLHTSDSKTYDEENTLPPFSIQKQVVTLTNEQKEITDYLIPHIDQQIYAPTLMHGVTGSGKTEVYKTLIQHCIAQHKSVILLLPEVSLALQFQHLFKTTLASVTTFGFHSASSAQEKKLLWKALLEQKPILIIGVHLPVLMPISNLGLIIVDEEHESGFQEKKHPKINSKEAAITRAYLYHIPILLGSATPSITSLYNVTTKGWKLFQLKKRFLGSFPTVKKVALLNPQTQKRKFFWITKELEEALTHCLAKKEQAIIYMNRRGYSFFVQCKGCGFIFNCAHCSVSLTLHMRSHPSPSTLLGTGTHATRSIEANGNKTNRSSRWSTKCEWRDTNDNQSALLSCHYCGTTKQLPSFCPTCKAPEAEFIKKGIGTQQVVHILKTLFPHASIERADLDTTKKKRSWHETVQLFYEKKIDILVGTKTITKGYHFPAVTLVGIIWADLTLHFPHFSANETTLQQLIQVAGRAGRTCDNSTVIAQIMHDHTIFNHLNEQNYLTFAQHELDERKTLMYPPFCRLIHCEIIHNKSTQVEQDAQLLAQHMHTIITEKKLAITLLGPAQPIVYKIQNNEIRHIFLKAPTFAYFNQLFMHLDLKAFKSNVFIVPHG